MRIMLKSKIHRANVTSINKEYEGSIEIDEEVMDLAKIVPFEQVHIYNISNGQRFITYAIKGEKGERRINVHGAAARLVSEGDIIIIASYGIYREEEVLNFKPRVVYMDNNNEPRLN